MSTSSSTGPPARDRDRLSDHDKSIIGRASQLAGVSGPAAVRAYFGSTIVSGTDTAHAYAEALSQASSVIGELLAIIERLTEAAGAGVTMDRQWDEPSAHGEPESGGQVGATPAQFCDYRWKRHAGPARTYEITFVGRAGDTLRAAFDDCTVIVGPGTTTLRAPLPDQAALWGLVQRIIGLGLEVVDVHLMAPDSR
jgi:hypothetical protein